MQRGFSNEVQRMSLTFSVAPPPTRIEPLSEILHGVKISDPYRWLEDQKSPSTRRWLEAQIAHARAHLDAVPGRDRIRNRIRELLDVPFVSEPWKSGERYFFHKRSPGQEQPVIVMREGASPNEIVLVDPAERGGAVVVGILAVSVDGKYLAYSVRSGGGDAYTVEFFDVARRQPLPDGLPNGYCLGLAFCSDGKGFHYSHVPAKEAREPRRSVCRHTFGTSMESDVEIFSVESKQRRQLNMFSFSNGQQLGYIVSSLEDPPSSDLYVHDLAENKPPRLIAKEVKGHFHPVPSGDHLLVMTDWAAPNYKILAIDPGNPEERNWRELVPESERQIQCFAVMGELIFVSYVLDSTSRVEIFDQSGKKRGTLHCPSKGTVQLQPWPSQSDTLFYRFSSFNHPPEIRAYHVPSGESALWAKSSVPFDPSSIEVSRVTYPSKDGTEVPMFLVFNKNSEREGPRPTFLTGYGGFGASITPQFAVYAAFLIEHGFLFAIANLRGGSELGKHWHLAGKRHNRQNAFNDFISAGEWLLARGYAAPDKLAIGGGSNAGLLVGAALTQRPDLFRAVLCQGPLLDMLRYHKFDQADLWLEEYGSAEDADDFRCLKAYSPYHQVKPGTAYPAVMLISGDADTRCNPMHARKMAARLQAATSSGHPILLDYRPNWGHTPAQPLSARIDALTDKLAFVCSELGVAV